jgi:hypothetical protein
LGPVNIVGLPSHQLQRGSNRTGTSCEFIPYHEANPVLSWSKIEYFAKDETLLSDYRCVLGAQMDIDFLTHRLAHSLTLWCKGQRDDIQAT